MSTMKAIKRMNWMNLNRTCIYYCRYFKNTLSNPGLEMYRKEVIKKIIMYTTQGVDTSRFYPEMVIASGAKDIV